VLLLTSDERVMGEWKNPFVLKALGWLCAVLMAVSAAGIFVS